MFVLIMKERFFMIKMLRSLNCESSTAQLNMLGKIEQKTRDLIQKYFEQSYNIDLSLDFRGWKVSANPDDYGEVNIQVYIPVILGDMWRDFSYAPADAGNGRGTTLEEKCEEFVSTTYNDICEDLEDTLRAFVDHNLRKTGFDPTEIGLITVQVFGPNNSDDEWVAEIECEAINDSKREGHFDLTEKSITRMVKNYVKDIAQMTGAITNR